jgi:hypothetical protein
MGAVGSIEQVYKRSRSPNVWEVDRGVAKGARKVPQAPAVGQVVVVILRPLPRSGNLATQSCVVSVNPDISEAPFGVLTLVE